MSKGRRLKGRVGVRPNAGPRRDGKRRVSSLLDEMEDGREYASIVDCEAPHLNVRAEMQRAIAELSEARSRHVVCYLANVVRPGALFTSIDASDELPFSEMIDAVPRDRAALDVVISTPGGQAHQVARFVERVRSRFEDVGIIVPFKAMSAGTLWAMSGNEILMPEGACLGPIDPQVPDRNGRFLPAQAILTLVDQIRIRGEEALKKGQQPAWTDVTILRQMDPKELGNAMSLSAYSIGMAADYIENHKFRDWTRHSSTGKPVTPEERATRAVQIATDLCMHSLWQTHGHGLTRDALWDQLQIKIEPTEADAAVDRAVRRLWALVYYLLESMPLSKIFISQDYALFRSRGEPK